MKQKIKGVLEFFAVTYRGFFCLTLSCRGLAGSMPTRTVLEFSGSIFYWGTAGTFFTYLPGFAGQMKKSWTIWSWGVFFFSVVLLCFPAIQHFGFFLARRCQFCDLLTTSIAQYEKHLKGGKGPHPQDFSLTRKTARFTKGQFRPY